LSVGILVAVERRASGSSLGRAVLWGFGALAAALALALVKWVIRS
jgi:hypothetical protein